MLLNVGGCPVVNIIYWYVISKLVVYPHKLSVAVSITAVYDLFVRYHINCLNFLLEWRSSVITLLFRAFIFVPVSLIFFVRDCLCPISRHIQSKPFSSLNFQLCNTFLYEFCFLFSLTSIFTPARLLIPSEVSTKIVSSFIPSSLSPNASNECLEREWFRNERKNLQILIPTCLPADDWVAKVQCRKLKGLTLKSDPPRPTARLKMCELLVIGDLLGPHLSSFVRWQGVRRGYLVADPS